MPLGHHVACDPPVLSKRQHLTSRDLYKYIFNIFFQVNHPFVSLSTRLWVSPPPIFLTLLAFFSALKRREKRKEREKSTTEYIRDRYTWANRPHPPHILQLILSSSSFFLSFPLLLWSFKLPKLKPFTKKHDSPCLLCLLPWLWYDSFHVF